MTISTITTLTIAKLLPNAAARACDPASSAVTGAGGVIVVMIWLVAHDQWLLLESIVGNASEQIKRRRAFVKNQSRTLIERLLQRVNAQKKIRQFRILLEHRQHFCGGGLAFAPDAGSRQPRHC